MIISGAPLQVVQGMVLKLIRYSFLVILCAAAMFSGLECASEKIRGRHDVGNELAAGCATGAALAAGQGIQAQCLGCVGFAAFSYAINVFTGGKF